MTAMLRAPFAPLTAPPEEENPMTQETSKVRVVLTLEIVCENTPEAIEEARRRIFVDLHNWEEWADPRVEPVTDNK